MVNGGDLFVKRVVAKQRAACGARGEFAEIDAGGIQSLDGAEVFLRDVGDVGDLQVAYGGGIDFVQKAAEDICQVVAPDAAFVIGAERGSAVGQEPVFDAIFVVGSVPVFTGVFGCIEGVSVVCRMNTGGNSDGVRPCDGLLRAESAVGVADHNASVVADLDAGVRPMTAQQVAVGIPAHVGDLFKCIEPTAGRSKSAERKQARKDKHERYKSGKLLHTMTSGRTDGICGLQFGINPDYIKLPWVLQ